MIIRGEHIKVEHRPPEALIEAEATQHAQPTSVYAKSGDFLEKADELLVGYDVSAQDIAISKDAQKAYTALRIARLRMGRDFNNTDEALAEGDVSYEHVVFNATKVWPIKNLGRPSWPNAPY